jgi:hypothetical protein
VTRVSGDHETIMRMGRLVLWESKVGLGGVWKCNITLEFGCHAFLM